MLYSEMESIQQKAGHLTSAVRHYRGIILWVITTTPAGIPHPIEVASVNEGSLDSMSRTGIP